MSGFRRILAVYLTAALMLTLAISCFDSASISVFRLPEGTEVTEGTAADIPATEETVTDSTPHTEHTTKEEITEENASVEEDTAEKEEAVTENKADGALTEEEEDIITFSEILAASPVLRNNYSPDSSAEKVTPLLFLSENTDALATADSVNVYTFTANKRSVFSYTFTHDAPITTEGWEISLYCEYYLNGDGGETAYRLVDTRRTTALTVDYSPELGLAPGNYRLVVKKGNLFTSGTYKIEAKLSETADYEIECNDNIYRYTEIYSSVPVKGSASLFPDRQDEDYYLFRMYEDGFIDLKFEHGTVKDKVSVCWQVLLFSEDGTCLYSVNSLFTDTINQSGKIGLLKGNYYVLIRNRVYADMTYVLTLSRTNNTDYENEKNDTAETANLIGIGSTVTGSVASQINGIDRDYFKFSIPSNGTVVIDFAHEPIADSNDKNGWNTVLLDEQGNMLYRGISAWADDVTVSSPTGLGKGTYYIRIDSENLYLNSEKYYLTVSFTESSDTETEFNNSFDTADTLLERTPVTGNLSERATDYDMDFYVLDLTEESDITVEFTHEVLSVSREIFNFTLCDSNYEPVAVYSEEGEGATLIKSLSDSEKTEAVYKKLPAGKYFIKVTPGIFYSEIQYSLSYIKGE
ncbi:MAG: hypothetical protein IJN70_03900 [Clostridia bacterium]|nr:hypothetical protein [Clostridia bacterium]